MLQPPCGGRESVAKPVLAYSGSLPKDYFRCPCCGAVVDAAERATVPFRMVLQHLQKLDIADGVVDGDSPALRAIAATLDKVSSRSAATLSACASSRVHPLMCILSCSSVHVHPLTCILARACR